MDEWDSVLSRVKYQLTEKPLEKITVTAQEYQEFLRHSIFDTLAGLRLGQSFCVRHGISNASPLYHFKDDSVSDRWIRDNYVV